MVNNSEFTVVEDDLMKDDFGSSDELCFSKGSPRVSKEMVRDEYRDSVTGYMSVMDMRTNRFEVLPGLNTAGKWPTVIKDLVIDLCNELPQYTLGWSRLLSVPGTRCTPFGSASNAISWNPSPVMKSVCRKSATLSGWGRKIGPQSQKRTSNNSYPSMSANPIIKYVAAMQTYENIELLLTCIKNKDIKLLHRFKVPYTFGSFNKYRFQCDKYVFLKILNDKITQWEKKKRYCTDWLGHDVQQDKSITPFLGSGWEFLSTKRARVVCPIENSSNSCAQNWFNPCLAGQMLLNSMHYSQHKDVLELLDEIPGDAYFFKDETNNDMHFIREVYDLMVDGYQDCGLAAEMGTWLKLINRGPIVIYKDSYPVNDYCWNYPPDLVFEMYNTVDHGMRSGNAGVTTMTKDEVSSKDFGGCVEGGLFDDTWSNLYKFRHNKLPLLRYVNQGDNVASKFANDHLADLYVKGREKLGYPVEKDDTKNFTGNDLVFRNGYGMFEPAIDNFLANILSPERPITSGMRSNWLMGLYLREVTHYFKNPIMDKVKAITDNVLAQYNLPTLTDYTRHPNFEIPKNLQLDNIHNLQFIFEPDSIHWKLDREKVSRELIDQYFISFDTEYVEQFDNVVCSNKPMTQQELEVWCQEKDRHERRNKVCRAVEFNNRALLNSGTLNLNYH